MSGARGPQRLFHRIYLHGLALLALVGLSLALFGWLFGRESRWHRYPERLARHVAGLLAPLPEAALPREVERLGAELDLSLALYAQDGRPLARVGPRALDPLPPGEAARLAGAPERLERQHLDVSVAAGPARYLRLSLRQSGHELFAGALAGLALVVLVLALASAPLARALARPLEQLAGTARRLGEGDLSARTGLRGADELGALGQAFDEMAERLTRLVASQRELLADVSHELRTPLARLRVTLGLAAEAEPERARALLREVEGDLSELDGLVGDILAAARLEAVGAQALQRARLDLCELVRQAVARLARLHPGRTVDARLAAPGQVEGDAGLLGRVFDNLLDNAAKYSEPATSIEVRLEPAGDVLRLAVQDRGRGLSAEDQARLFTPFFRADPSRARGTGGVGLGLALCQRVVAAHGGRIAVESRLGEGTTVTVELPVAPRPASG